MASSMFSPPPPRRPKPPRRRVDVPPGNPTSRSLKLQKLLLATGALAPVIGGCLVFAAMLGNPGYDQGRQYLSELGARGAPDRELFNLGIGLTGLFAIVSGTGNYLALSGLSRRRLPAALVAGLLIVAGIGLTLSAFIAWPDRRHYWAVQVALGAGLCPFLLVWCLWDLPQFAPLRWFLILCSGAILTLTLLTKHLIWPSVVNSLNVGWWESGFAVVLVLWLTVLDMLLHRRIVDPASQTGAS